jgi:putative copper resistance protein D
MIEVGLVLARLLHYAATTSLAGLSFFPLYAYADSEPAGLNGWRRMLLLSTALAALFGGLLWFVFAAANMSGSLADVADPGVIWSVVRETGFGAVWTARMVDKPPFPDRQQPVRQGEPEVPSREPVL